MSGSQISLSGGGNDRLLLRSASRRQTVDTGPGAVRLAEGLRGLVVDMIDQIICGDCLEEMPSIPDKSIDMILCDLPYGTTHNAWDVPLPLWHLWGEYRRVIKLNGAIVLTAQQPFATDLIASGRDIFRYELIWEKTCSGGFLNANKMPLRSHENILVFYKKLPVYNSIKTPGDYWERDRKAEPASTYGAVNAQFQSHVGRYPRSVLKISNHNGALWGDTTNHKKHPTAKPVALFEYLIKTYTNEGNLVLDNCIGSGTTAVAAKRTGRHFIGIELSEEYCAIARKRIAAVPARLDRWVEGP